MKHTPSLPKIGITLGDPGGIGPEIVFKTLVTKPVLDLCVPVIFGSHSILKHPKIQTYLKNFPIQSYFVNCGDLPIDFVIGRADSQNGKSAYDFLEKALSYLSDKRIEGLVTAPICKESFALAHIPYTGHTSLLQDKTNSPRVSMAFYTPRLKTVLATIHHAYAEVPRLLTDDTLHKAVEHSYEFARLLHIHNPKIALAALNPHAGENGLFGREELEILIPFVEKQRAGGRAVLGPFPADSLYYRAYQGEFDIVISLYHDQGLIPIKLLDFHSAVNLTLGLPFIRTSPDHGVAFDIAYQDQANLESFYSALQLAISQGI